MSNILWTAADRKRRTFEGRVRRVVIRALNVQIYPVILAIEAGQSNPAQFAEEAPIRDAFREFYPLVGIPFAKQTYLQFMKSDSSDIQTKDDRLDIQTQVQENFWKMFMQEYATEAAGERIIQITNTTQDIIRGVLKEAVTEGWGTEKTAREMRKKWNAVSRVRARVISRTEILSASNHGSLLGARSTGLRLNKKWLATTDTRTRDTHAEANGQTVDIQADFVVNGKRMDHPGDPRGGAEETIECRCTAIYESKAL